jgi:hypothetical protein
MRLSNHLLLFATLVPLQITSAGSASILIPVQIASAGSASVAISTLEISNAGYTIPVPPGYGVVLDLSKIGQRVTGAGFGDSTKFVISGLDGNLCYLQEKCRSTGASVILLKSIMLPKEAKQASFPTQTYSADGGTSLTLVTDGRQGRRILSMRVVSVLRPQFTALVVEDPIQPLVPPSNRTVLSSNFKPLPVLKVPAVRRSTTALLPPPPAIVPIVTPTPVATSAPEPKPTSSVSSNPEVQLAPNPSRSLKGNEKPKQPKKLKTSQVKTATATQSPISIAPSDQIPTSPASPEPTPEVALSVPAIESTPATIPETKPTSPPLKVATSSFKGYTTQQLARIADAHALHRGLNLAIASKKTAYGTSRYYKVQTAIGLLKQGKSRRDAAQGSGLSLDLINQWIAMGQS